MHSKRLNMIMHCWITRAKGWLQQGVTTLAGLKLSRLDSAFNFELRSNVHAAAREFDEDGLPSRARAWLLRTATSDVWIRPLKLSTPVSVTLRLKGAKLAESHRAHACLHTDACVHMKACSRMHANAPAPSTLLHPYAHWRRSGAHAQTQRLS